MKMHKCACGGKDLPGRVVFRIGRFMVVFVDAENGNFLEFRWARQEGLAHVESLIYYLSWAHDSN